MSDTAIPLPKEAAGYALGCNQDLQEGDLLYTADQMREYAAQCVAAERERCATLCENTEQEFEQYTGQPRKLNYTCADAIRAG